MSKWKSIQSAALSSHGIVTFAQAKAMGVYPAELYRWCKSERLTKLNRGVFRLTAYPMYGWVSDMAAILASIGDGAFLYGESALQLYNLCSTRSYVVTVGYPHRLRKANLSKGISVIKTPTDYKTKYHNGIATQSPAEAIKSCVGVLERDRLIEAIDEAENQGYLTPHEAAELRAEI